VGQKGTVSSSVCGDVFVIVISFGLSRPVFPASLFHSFIACRGIIGWYCCQLDSPTVFEGWYHHLKKSGTGITGFGCGISTCVQTACVSVSTESGTGI
jgi:hypothetical protein